jgi:16S rRNA processing protein RimM
MGSPQHKSQPVPVELVRVGYVSGAHGIRGALRVRMDNPDSEVLQSLRELYLAKDQVSTRYDIAGVQRAARGTIKLVLGGINAVEDAENTRGAIVMVAASDLPPPAQSEFYYYQAIGCEVVTSSGFHVGVVEQIFSNGAHDILVVRDGSVERLVPVIDDVVKGIDWTARRVTIEAVPGLLD